jgi:Rrf2 family iron-sulfur cluster assembly transcriptional regulator
MLNTTVEYALRAMIELARAEAEDSVLGRDLAVRSGVPANYLAKILLTLNHAGFVSAARGSGGGYQLNRAASDIHLVEIVDVFDTNGAHPRCLLDMNMECSDTTPCTAHERWKSVRRAYIAFLHETSLKDIAGI